MANKKRTPTGRKAGAADYSEAVAKKRKPSLSGLKLLGGLLFKRMAAGGAGEISSRAEEVNRLNVFPVPDGDTGDNMRMTIESGIRAVENMDTDNLAAVMKALSHGMLLGARGNSGVILSQFFAGMSAGLEGAATADAKALGEALGRGVDRAYSSVMTPTEGTILTVAREAVEYAGSRITSRSTIRSFFRDLVGEMRASVERTPEILPLLKEAGVVDSGGAGLFYIMDGFNRVLNDEEIAAEERRVSASASSAPISFDPDCEMPYGYCTELLLGLCKRKCDPSQFDVDELKRYLSTLGDSIVAFKEENIVKLHVHTHTPDLVLSYSLKYGDFISVKIENMSLRHSESRLSEGQTSSGAHRGGLEERKECAVVAVCNGEGMISIYRELGADEIIIGGQTKNPSTGDFLEAFARLSANHIIVLPNNGNILMAAEQAAALYTGAEIHVIPTKSMATGYVALSSTDLTNEDAVATAQKMREAADAALSGFVSPSIRGADINGVHINEGDSVGIVGKEITVSDKDRICCAVKLAERLLAVGEKFILTVFSGIDVTEEEALQLRCALLEKFPKTEIYIQSGGQEIYPYLMVSE